MRLSGAFVCRFGLAALAIVQPGPSLAGEAKFQWPPSEFECRFTELPVTIDGKDDDAAWQQAQVIDNFFQPWKVDKAGPARTKTRAKLLWDREYLYFCADMEDTDLYADVKERDGMTWDNDVFELFFKPADDKPGYYEFQVNAAGTVMDMFIPRRGAGGYKRFIKDGAFHIDAKVALRGTLNKWQDKDQGWSVEGKVPWKDFVRTGGRPDLGEKWKFSLCRYDYSVDFEGPDLSTCAPLKSKMHADFHLHEDFATLKFVRAPVPKAEAPKVDEAGKDGKKAKGKAAPTAFSLTERVPLTTSKVIGSPEPPLPFRAVRAYPDLKLKFLIGAAQQPGSDSVLFIQSATASNGATTLRRFTDVPAAKDAETVVEFSDTAFDLTFHPKFADNGYFYVGSNGKRDGGPKMTRATRYTMERKPPYKVDPKSAQVIIEWESDGHNGAAVAFGHDGMLYITSGDGTSDSDTLVVGQDMTSLLAKVLRIDVDHPDKGKAYAVPKDNPFLTLPKARPEIWALGLRNPWRMTVDQKTGHVWVAQNGQDLFEQAFLVKKGDNYGWSVTEGSGDFYPTRPRGPNFYTKPTVEHPHSEARSLTGGIVYYGQKHPDLQGAYIYGDYSTGRIWAVKHDGTKILWHKEICDSRLAITGFTTDAHGEVLILDYQNSDKGGFYALERTPKETAPSTFPRTLSDSGLFRSVAGHVMEPSLMPYSVNAVLWSDGANKERWLGIPGEHKFTFPARRGWEFPDQTVLVKSFYLDMEEGNPAARQWIETRFLTRQRGEWFGYSYAWNEEQTEGFLVEGKGRDRDFHIKTKAGAARKQTWHYPSRAECMVCHSRAANWVLGLSDVQFNKAHNYGGVWRNQLAVLEGFGMLQTNYWNDLRDQLRDEAKAEGMNDKEANDHVAALMLSRNQRGPLRSTALLGRTPENYRHLVDPYDKKQDIGLRARSYLHSNCAQCHVEAGGGNAQMELEFKTPLDKMRLIDVMPVHDTYGIADAKLVAPGHPEKSILLHRMQHRGKGHMPPLATSMVDQAAVDLLREWIIDLGKQKKEACP